jgi:hypothetical protein
MQIQENFQWVLRQIMGLEGMIVSVERTFEVANLKA